MAAIKSLRWTFACLCSFAGCHAVAADWHFAGTTLVSKESYIVFFDAHSVQKQQDETVRVWIESIPQTELDRLYKAHGKAAIDAAAAKVAAYYVPLW